MTQFKPSMYNHYAVLIPVESNGGGLLILNELVNQQGIPWWKKTEEMHGYDCSAKQPKPYKQKKELNKDEWKQYNKALTYHHLKEQENGAEVAEEMGKRLETAVKKDDDSSDLSLVSSNESNDGTGERIASLRTLSTTKVGRTLTGVKERTLSGWLCQKKMIQMWVDLVKDMTAEVALKS